MKVETIAGELKKPAGGCRRPEAVPAPQSRYLGCHGRAVTTIAVLLWGLLFAACGKSDSHPLKGAIVEVYAEAPALLVEHEEIPGVMAAMTMKFSVDAETVARVRQGQKIEARLRFQDGTWRLNDVKVVSSP